MGGHTFGISVLRVICGHDYRIARFSFKASDEIFSMHEINVEIMLPLSQIYNKLIVRRRVS